MSRTTLSAGGMGRIGTTAAAVGYLLFAWLVVYFGAILSAGAGGVAGAGVAIVAVGLVFAPLVVAYRAGALEL